MAGKYPNNVAGNGSIPGHYKESKYHDLLTAERYEGRRNLKQQVF
jgi:hypothetical protein